MRKLLIHVIVIALLAAPLVPARAAAYTAPTATSFSTAVAVSAPTVVMLQGQDLDGTPLTFATTTTPAHGALSNLNAATGAVVYTPTAGYTGSDSFNFTVTSGGETSSAATVTITVTAAKTRIITTFTNPDGSARQGKASFFLTQLASSPGGLIVPKASVTCQLTASGQCDVSLYPSSAVNPEQHYQVWFEDSKTLNTQFLGLYNVLASTTTITLDPYRVTDANLAARFTFASEAAVRAYGAAVSAATLAALTAEQVAAALGFTPEDASKKGQADGYADLDSAGKVPVARLPPAALGGAAVPGVTAHWTLDESSGLRADGVLFSDLGVVNTVSTAAGKIGSAAHFTGAGALGVADNASVSTGGGSFSVWGWVKAGAIGSGSHVVAQKSLSNGTQKEYALYFANHVMQFSVSGDGVNWTGTRAASTFGAADTNWHFYAAWYDAAAQTINVRVDGGAVDSSPYTGGVIDGTGPLYLGGWAGLTSLFIGDLDEFGFARRVLTSSERAALYNSGAGLASPHGTRPRPPRGVWDPNAEPYNCVPDVAEDQTPCLRSVINDAVNYAFNTGPPTAALDVDPGKYTVSAAPIQDSVYNAQIPIPVVGGDESGPRPYLLIRSKNRAGSPTPYGTTRGGANVIFKSTLTGQSYSSTYGIPCIMGGPDILHAQTGTPDIINGAFRSVMTVHLQGVGFEAPSNPSLCGFNGTMIDRVILEDVVATTSDLRIGYPDAAEPTHPTGLSFIMPRYWNGSEYRGTIEVTGWYAGPGISELTTISGNIYSIQNKVGLNLYTPYYQGASVGKSFLVRNPYGIAQVDPATGIVAPKGFPTADLTGIYGNVSFEDEPTWLTNWRSLVCHVCDPNNKLVGQLDYFHILSGPGSTVAGLTNQGAQHVRQTNLLRPGGYRGKATLSGGTVTVSVPFVHATSIITVTGQDSNVTGTPRVSARSEGVSFTITSSNPSDSGVVGWRIDEP